MEDAAFNAYDAVATDIELVCELVTNELVELFNT